MFNAIQSSSGYGTEVSNGIVINFYYSECPPDLEPDLSYTFAWSDLSPELVYSGGWVSPPLTTSTAVALPIWTHPTGVTSAGPPRPGPRA